MPKHKHILVIRLSAMGDVAIVAPLIQQFINRYPKVKITVLTRKQWAPIFEQISQVDVLCPDLYGIHKGIWGLYKLSREIVAKNVDGVADLHGVLRSHLLGAFLCLKGIKVAKINKGRSKKKALTRPQKKTFKALETTASRYSKVFAALGYPLDHEQLQSLSKRDAAADVQTHLPKRVGIAPFAAYPSKTYPTERIENIVKQLSQTDNCEVFLFGGGNVQTDLLMNWQNNYSNTISCCGTFSFLDELSLISQLDVMVSMDSGNGHLAAMYGVPTIILWGVTHPYAGFAPMGKAHHLLPDLDQYPMIPTSVYGNKYPQEYETAIASIDEQDVINKIYQVATL